MSEVCVLQPDDWRGEVTSVVPDFFHRPRRAPCPIECGPGWAMVVDRLCVRIAATLKDRESFRFDSIGSHDGALRIRRAGRLSAASEAAVRSAVDLPEARSMCVCELCGARGRRFRADGVISTRCLDHADGGRAFSRDGGPPSHAGAGEGRMRVVIGARYVFAGDAFVRSAVI